ncbi:AAEL003319-PA [Aedes aegypti]|uniref:AAEL003319-PA n=1 Tax=Aedes aegypti TaxID=7159 RepID=Q17FR6_AEDAE|nr:AAEL003319-PA [Aedes aegypti]
MKSFIIALVCISTAFADVSELFLQPVPLVHHDHIEEHHHQEARPYDILSEHEPSTLELISEAIHEEEPAAVPFGLANEGVEIVEAIEVLPVADGEVQRVQLTETHQDYQGPYHYEKPKVQLDYGAPIVAEKVPEVEAPIVKDQLVDNNYLPPKYSQDNLVKRHIKYIVRRRV